MAVTAVTPSGVRDGDPFALAGLCDRRGPAVLAYCREVAGDAAATAAAAEAFARFRAAVVAADDPARVNPEAVLLSATRHAAVRHARGPAAGLCADVPRLLAARADRSISLADLERLEAHLVMCTPCRAPVERFRAAEDAYRDPPSSSVTPEQSAVIVAALAAAAPVRSIAVRRASVEAPALIPPAPRDAPEEPRPQPTVEDGPPPTMEDDPPVSEIEPPPVEPDADMDEQPAAVEADPVSDAGSTAIVDQPTAVEAEPVRGGEQNDELRPISIEPELAGQAEPGEQPAEVDPEPEIDDQPIAADEQPAAPAEREPVTDAEPAADAEPAGDEQPAAAAEPAADEQPAAPAEREPVTDAERSPVPEPVAAAHAELTPDDHPATLEPAPAIDPEPAHAAGPRPAAPQPAFAASTSTIDERDERPTQAAAGDRPAVELAPLTAAARHGAGQLSPPTPQSAVDTPTTEYRVIDDFELHPDLASDSGVVATNGTQDPAPIPVGLGGFGSKPSSPSSGGPSVPAMRRAGARRRASGGTHLPRPQRAPAANAARASGTGLRPSILLPVGVIALSLVVALFVAGVFGSDDRASEAGATVPGAPPATATTTPEIVVVPGARAASAAEVERAKARARAQRRREARLGGAPAEADSEAASAPVRDEGGAVVDASPAPADPPPPAAGRPPAVDRPRDDTGGTGVDADNASTGGRQVPPSQDASTVPDLAPPAEPVTPP